MTTTPLPDQTPHGPAFEGRLLPRPDDDVVDQGAGFDIGTVLTRRRILSLFGAGAGAVALAACGADGSTSSTSSTSAATTSTTSAGEIPEETNGPYPADGTADLNILQQSGIERSDITTNLDGTNKVDGVPLTLTFNLVDMAGGNVPFAGAALYAWSCDAQGRYSMYTAGVEDQTFLRGIQAADADGNLTFTTIVPGCYSGRWPHIHFEVYPDLASATDVANVIATSQLAFEPDLLAQVYALDTYPGSTSNLAAIGTQISDDNLFGSGDWSLQVPTVTGSVDAGYTATLTVNIDTTTEPGSAAMGGPGGGPGGPPPSN